LKALAAREVALADATALKRLARYLRDNCSNVRLAVVTCWLAVLQRYDIMYLSVNHLSEMASKSK